MHVCHLDTTSIYLLRGEVMLTYAIRKGGVVFDA